MGSFSHGDLIALGGLGLAATGWSVQWIGNALGATRRNAVAQASSAQGDVDLKSHLDRLSGVVEGLVTRLQEHEIESAAFRGQVTSALEALTRRRVEPVSPTRRPRPASPSESRLIR